LSAAARPSASSTTTRARGQRAASTSAWSRRCSARSRGDSRKANAGGRPTWGVVMRAGPVVVQAAILPFAGRGLAGRTALHREAAPAAAGGLGVGVADGELRAVQAFDVV